MHSHTPLTYAHTYLYKHSLAPTYLLTYTHHTLTHILSHIHTLHTLTNTYTFTHTHIYTLSHANTHIHTGTVTSHILNTYSHMHVHTQSTHTHSHAFLLQPTFFLEVGTLLLEVGRGRVSLRHQRS